MNTENRGSTRTESISLFLFGSVCLKHDLQQIKYILTMVNLILGYDMENLLHWGQNFRNMKYGCFRIYWHFNKFLYETVKGIYIHWTLPTTNLKNFLNKTRVLLAGVDAYLFKTTPKFLLADNKNNYRTNVDHANNKDVVEIPILWLFAINNR